MNKKRFIQLIDKFLLGKASEGEQQLVVEYLDRLEAAGETVLDSAAEQHLQETMWRHIQLQTTQTEIAIVGKPWYKKPIVRLAALAASLAMLVGLATFLFNDHPSKQSVVQGTKKTDTISYVVRHVVNKTGKDENVRLSDSSLVILANNSELSFNDPFTNKRDITLIGKAYFKVAKDATKPFTVSSRNITTTALGTEFLVTAYEKKNLLTVRLYEGKVVVKSVAKDDWRMKKDFYLKPGEEFVYSNDAFAKVRVFKAVAAEVEPSTDHPIADEPFMPKDVKGTWYMFNNQSLGQVLDQLAFTYNVHIVYNKKDVKNKYFVGKFNKSDSLEVILKYIMIVNKLKIAKNEDTYYINK